MAPGSSYNGPQVVTGGHVGFHVRLLVLLLGFRAYWELGIEDPGFRGEGISAEGFGFVA